MCCNCDVVHSPVFIHSSSSSSSNHRKQPSFTTVIHHLITENKLPSPLFTTSNCDVLPNFQTRSDVLPFARRSDVVYPARSQRDCDVISPARLHEFHPCSRSDVISPATLVLHFEEVEKTRDLGPLPSFSIGLTQSEEEQRNVTASSSGGDKNKERESDEAKGKEKKPYIKKNEKKKQQNEAQDSDEGKSDDENAKQRLRHKMSIPKVYELMHSVHGKRRKEEIIELLNDSGFGGMLRDSVLQTVCWEQVFTVFPILLQRFHFPGSNVYGVAVLGIFT